MSSNGAAHEAQSDATRIAAGDATSSPVRTRPHVVVVGAGAAGHSAATTLRREGYGGALSVVHDEPSRPYNRTLVNKAVLPGLLTSEQAALPPLDTLDVQVVPGRATGLDPATDEVVLSNGERMRYTALLIATGSAPRALTATTAVPPAASAAAPGRVTHLHTVEDAARIRELLGTQPAATRVTLLGAGFIGAETAGYLNELGANVTLVSRTLLPLAPAVGDVIAARVVELHQEHITTHFGRTLVSLDDSPASRPKHSGPIVVTLNDGTVLESDLVVVARGTTPDLDWVTGLTEGELVVDDRLRVAGLTRVYAAGSVATHTSASGARYRVDHWDDAAAQGVHAARTLMHDIAAAPDPGAYAPRTGFTLNLYRTPIAALGAPGVDAEQRQHAVADERGTLTTFHDRRSGAMTAAVGLHAGRELLALRDQIGHP